MLGGYNSTPPAYILCRLHLTLLRTAFAINLDAWGGGDILAHLQYDDNDHGDDDDSDDDDELDDEDQNANNSANFQARSSRFCMIIDLDNT